jgi:hypothetical protein
MQGFPMYRPTHEGHRKIGRLSAGRPILALTIPLFLRGVSRKEAGNGTCPHGVPPPHHRKLGQPSNWERLPERSLFPEARYWVDAPGRLILSQPPFPLSTMAVPPPQSQGQ